MGACMKLVATEGIMFIDAEPYGLFAASVNDTIADIDMSDSQSGSNYENLDGANKVNFTAGLFINTLNTPIQKGTSYTILISTEAFAYYGTGKISTIDSTMSLGQGLYIQISGFFTGTVARYGAEIFSNPYLTQFGATVATDFSVGTMTPTKGTSIWDRNMQVLTLVLKF